MVDEIVAMIEKDNKLTEELKEALGCAESSLHNGQAAARVLGLHVLGARSDRHELGNRGQPGKITEGPAVTSI
jgi:hypothetical protein